MLTKKLILSSAGLKNIVSGAEQNDEFHFIFGQQRIVMKNVFAEFISPAISKIHQSDPTINFINFNDILKDITLSENIISKFALLSKGDTIEIDEEESFQMKIISILINNVELFNKLNDLYSIDINESNIDHYLSNLAIFSKISSLFDCFDYQKIVDIISSHFYSIDKKKLKQYPNSILYSIISNSNLRLESEDSLLDFINDIFSEKGYNSESIYFYEEVEYSMLSEEKFNEFIEKFDSSKVTHNLWFKLRKCFYTNHHSCINEVNEDRYLPKSIKKKEEIKASPETNGIIEYLTNQIEGDICEKGVLNVTASSTSSSNFAKNVAYLHSNLYFLSNNLFYSWLKYDFIQLKVNPTRYSITSRPYYDNQPRNWVIEGSNNDDNWDVLDNRQNDQTLIGGRKTFTFDIKKQDKSYRFLRIRQTGMNSSNSYFLSFTSLEFFGSISE